MLPKSGGGSTTQQTHKEISLSDTAVLLAYSHKVFIVPGLDFVAQAQHARHELENYFTEKGVEVKYAIHPVAGRDARSYECITCRGRC